MAKTITVKYASKCVKCGGSIPQGAEAVWEKGENGEKSTIEHVQCPTTAPAESVDGLDTGALKAVLKEAFIEALDEFFNKKPALKPVAAVDHIDEMFAAAKKKAATKK